MNYSTTGTLLTFSDLKKEYRNHNRDWMLQDAQKRKLFPLRPSAPLAQLCGHLMGDGYLRVTKRVGGHINFCGPKEKLEDIARIYRRLFRKQLSVRSVHGHYFRIETTDSVVARSLRHIGVPVGEKVMNPFLVPSWIFSGGTEVKRKFLQALVDDEMEGPYKNKHKPNTWTGLRLRMNKNELFLQEGLGFFYQLGILFKHFGVETTAAKIYPAVAFVRRDGTKNYRIVLRVRNNMENRLRFLREIGFIYDQKRQDKLRRSVP